LGYFALLKRTGIEIRFSNGTPRERSGSEKAQEIHTRLDLNFSANEEKCKRVMCSFFSSEDSPEPVIGSEQECLDS
jgi:hypothetical protein